MRSAARRQPGHSRAVASCPANARFQSMRPVSCIATNSVAIEPIVMDGRMLVIGGVDGALYGFRVG